MFIQEKGKNRESTRNTSRECPDQRAQEGRFRLPPYNSNTTHFCYYNDFVRRELGLGSKFMEEYERKAQKKRPKSVPRRNMSR